MNDFKKLRKRAGLNQMELAERLGTSQSGVSAWERGRNGPPVRDIKKIARALGATVGEVVDCFAKDDEEV